MTPGSVKKELSKYIAGIMMTPAKEFMEKHDKIATELSENLSEVLNRPKEVEEYLDFVVDEISDLNEYFKKVGKRERIPYSKLFSFANKKERISGFIIDKKTEEKKQKERSPGMAGFDQEDDHDFSIIGAETEISGSMYGCIHVEDNYIFWFSPSERKVKVQFSNGEILSYIEYKRKLKSENKNFIKLGKIFKEIKRKEEDEDYSIAFMIYWRQKKAKDKRKNARRKGKKKSL